MSYAGKIKNDGADRPIASTLFGICQTIGNTAAKVVTLSDFDALVEGVTIHIMFQYSNTASNPTLNVNGTGAKPIYIYGTVYAGTTPYLSWKANTVVSLTYDGTAWRMNDTAVALYDLIGDVESALDDI